MHREYDSLKLNMFMWSSRLRQPAMSLGNRLFAFDTFCDFFFLKWYQEKFKKVLLILFTSMSLFRICLLLQTVNRENKIFQLIFRQQLKKKRFSVRFEHSWSRWQTDALIHWTVWTCQCKFSVGRRIIYLFTFTCIAFATFNIQFIYYLLLWKLLITWSILSSSFHDNYWFCATG